MYVLKLSLLGDTVEVNGKTQTTFLLEKFRSTKTKSSMVIIAAKTKNFLEKLNTQGACK